MVQCLLMFVQLAQHCAQLQMALAHVPKLEQLTRYVEFLSSLHYCVWLDALLMVVS